MQARTFSIDLKVEGVASSKKILGRKKNYEKKLKLKKEGKHHENSSVSLLISLFSHFYFHLLHAPKNVWGGGVDSMIIQFFIFKFNRNVCCEKNLGGGGAARFYVPDY